MRFSFFAAAVFAVTSFTESNAVSLETETKSESELAVEQITGYINGLPEDQMAELGQILSEITENMDYEYDDLSQTDLSGAVLEDDLETIAEYIVHLKKDEIHDIAMGCDQSPHKAIPVVRPAPTGAL